MTCGILDTLSHVNAKDPDSRMQPDPRSEEGALLIALRAGDPGAFEQLVREHAPRMLAVARRYLRQEDDAEAAVQDAFVSAHRALPGFHGESRLGTWLHRITVNAALGLLRRKRRLEREASLEDLLPRFRSDGHREAPGLPWVELRESRLEQAETRQKVREALDKLPEIHRTVLMLRDIDGFNTDETATLLGINENAVKARLHRARLALRTLLEPLFGGSDA